jgi:spermidine synthase
MLGTKVLEERESKFNGHLRVVKTLGIGTYIQADGLTQSGGIVESIWSSTLKRINKLTNQPINSCLILGLGGGTVAKLIRKNLPEAKITGVDIDPEMIELGKKYLGLDELDVDIKIQDALVAAKRLMVKANETLRDERYDLVIVDLYQGDNFPEKFATEEFIELARTVLTSSGMAVFNRLYYGDKRPEAVKFGLKLQKIFESVEYFYPEANLMFICSK